jgi:hypothetical protein
MRKTILLLQYASVALFSQRNDTVTRIIEAPSILGSEAYGRRATAGCAAQLWLGGSCMRGARAASSSRGYDTERDPQDLMPMRPASQNIPCARGHGGGRGRARRVSILLGGDCSIVLWQHCLRCGVAAAYGLLFIDGHADFYHRRP